jgi:inosine-uridine nucleoside N-ribohydrolase
VRVVLDMDAGIDDAVAIAYFAAHPDVEIVAFGGVHGNCRATDSAVNGLRVLEHCGLPDVPVAVGAEEPLDRPLRLRPFVHGEDGLGDAGFPAPRNAPTGEHAADQIVRLAQESPGELDLFAVGPLTNLSMALDRDPDVLTRYRSVVIMGGCGPFPPAGVVRQEDTNTEHDPTAAARVLAAPRTAMTTVGVNVTTATILDEAAIARLAAAPTPHAELVTRVLACYLDFYQHKWGRRICSLHDPLAAGVLVDPSIVAAAAEGPVNVIDDGAGSRAWLMIREDGGELVQPVTPAPPTRVVTRVEGERFARDLVDVLASRI